MDKDGWEMALANIASVKRLNRAASDATDILPNRRLLLSSGFKVPEMERNPYIGVVVGLEGLSAEKLTDNLNSRFTCDEEERALLPDLVACVKKGHLITRYKNTNGGNFNIGTWTLGNSYDGFRMFPVQDFVLSSLHLGLNVLLSGIRLRNRDLSHSWLDELLWIEHKSKVEDLLNSWEIEGDVSTQDGWDAMESEARARGEYKILSRLQDLRKKHST